MLAALDEYMYQRRRGIFALTVFACCFVNYYFFVGQVVFCLIYFAIRLIMKSWKISVRDFFLLLLEGILGVATSCVLLIPTILTIIQNPRVDNPPNGGTPYFTVIINDMYIFCKVCSSLLIFRQDQTLHQIRNQNGPHWAHGYRCSV